MWWESVLAKDPFKLCWFHDRRLLFWPFEEIAVARHDHVGVAFSGEVNDEVVVWITGERRPQRRVGPDISRRAQSAYVHPGILNADPGSHPISFDEHGRHFVEKGRTSDQLEGLALQPLQDDPISRTRVIAAEMSTLESSTARTSPTQGRPGRRRRIRETSSVAILSAASSVSSSPSAAARSKIRRTSRV